MDEKEKLDAFCAMYDEILAEIIEEESQRESERLEIIKNGCPHTDKEKRKGTFSGKEYFSCKVCYRQFDLDEKEIT